jgi:hypothetical protein
VPHDPQPKAAHHGGAPNTLEIKGAGNAGGTGRLSGYSMDMIIFTIIYSNIYIII